MNILRTSRIALRALARNKMRSFLTALGIIIGVGAVIAMVCRGQVIYANKNWNPSIQGTGARYPEVRNWEIELGTFFDETHVKAAAKVCVLGSEVKKSLFEAEDPIDKVIRVKQIPFLVLGVLKSKGEAGGFFNRDDTIFMPSTTVMKSL